MNIEKLKEGIYRVCIPFDTVYTTSFVLVNDGNAIILDSGANNNDAKDYIIPAVAKLGVKVKYILTTHTHVDHCGGIEALRAMYPDATVAQYSNTIGDAYYLKDEEVLVDRYVAFNLKGHSDDGLCLLDRLSNTLLTGDALQSSGIDDKYRMYYSDYDKALLTIQKIRDLNVDTIIASHDYEQCGFIADGKIAVKKYLDINENIIRSSIHLYDASSGNISKRCNLNL